jgi:hypothetical protein
MDGLYLILWEASLETVVPMYMSETRHVYVEPHVVAMLQAGRGSIPSRVRGFVFSTASIPTLMCPYYNPKMEAAGSSETAHYRLVFGRCSVRTSARTSAFLSFAVFLSFSRQIPGFVFGLYHYWSRDSSVGIVTRPTNQARARNVLTSTAPRPPLGPTQPRF